jgi:probable addiction module antidote protein
VKSALNRNVEREFDSSRKDMHWGKRKLKRGTNDGDRLGSKRADNREGGEQMSKATAFDTPKYRNNPKLIAKYLNDALATDDAAFAIRAIGNLARAHGMGAIADKANVDRAGLYRSLRGDMDPAFGTVLKVLAALGIQLVAKPAAGL